jgi:hypothetical protein
MESHGRSQTDCILKDSKCIILLEGSYPLIFKDSVPTAQKTHYISNTETSRLMLSFLRNNLWLFRELYETHADQSGRAV